jgi:hypothetical protein
MSSHELRLGNLHRSLPTEFNQQEPGVKTGPSKTDLEPDIRPILTQLGRVE